MCVGINSSTSSFLVLGSRVLSGSICINVGVKS